MNPLLLALCAISIAHTAVVDAVGWECATDVDCAGVPTATCSASLRECRCAAGQTFAANVTACVAESLHGESCNEDSQCAHMLTGAHCSGINAECTCADGYTYVRGRCRQLAPLLSRCGEDVDCFFGYDRESVACIESTCQCTPDYYQRDENICRRKSMNAGDPCVVHDDCVGEELSCNEFTLECDDGNAVDASAKATKTQPDSANEPRSRDASTATDDRKTVRFQQTQTSQVANDSEGASRYGDTCTAQPNNGPCPGLPHSECRHEQCQCRRGYYHNRSTGACMAEIGEVAASDELCSGDGRNATTGRCVCARNEFAMAHLRECIKPGFGIGYSCTEPSQCSPFGAAYCPGPNAPGRRVCTCHTYAEHDANRQMCVPRKGLGGQCTTTADCATQTPDTECAVATQLCVCRQHYVQTAAGTCERGVDASCQTTDECAQVENAECAQRPEGGNARCACRSGHVQVDEKCLKEATAIEEECAEDEQCQPLLGARGKCIDSACRCEAHLQHTNGKCNEKKALDEPCAASSECHVAIEPENAVCRNGACGCRFGTHKDTAQQACRKNSSSKMSALKAVTLLLIAAAIGVTTAAIHDAYF